jgi:hypothetical protein
MCLWRRGVPLVGERERERERERIRGHDIGRGGRMGLMWRGVRVCFST